MIFKHSIAVVAGVTLFISSASAATFLLQAGSGHLHQGSGTHPYADQFTDSFLHIIDGRSITLPSGVWLGGVTRVWDTPIPLSSTNQNWNAIAFGGGVTNRICAFNSSGGFTGCGASVFTGATSTTFVPTDGTAYSQTTLVRNCSAMTGACNGTTLDHIKAFN